MNMGAAPGSAYGIYEELGKGRRVALSKLAADSLETNDRPFRLAIDIAIWQYQTQAARGGTNPAIRTLFYRLVRLLATPIEPVFVFDGPYKPSIKRNKRSGRGDGVATAQAKRLIRLFGFAIHDAPGEAEAECALLQRHGIVDAVLSEDVDTIMFGCTKTLRNLSSESKGSKTPTHVSLYDATDSAITSRGLDREGMVLVALMSGGDYLPEGIPGCGVKIACEAARAGFGKSLCRLKASDAEGIAAWREDLIRELQTNERNFFRRKHKSLAVPEDFPKVEVLRYYTHPAVSRESDIETIRENTFRHRPIEVQGLREFARETFDWDYRIGAYKFIRVLGTALLVRSLRNGDPQGETHVKRISGRRTHFSTDATPELRVAYIPKDIVPIDLSQEVDESISYGHEGLALNSEDEAEMPAQAENEDVLKPSANEINFDPSKPALSWVLEIVAKKSAPTAFREWQEGEAAKALRKSPVKKKSSRARPAQVSDMPRGAIEGFFRITKDLESSNTAVSVKATSRNRLRSRSPSTPHRLRTTSSKQAMSRAETQSPRIYDRSPGTPRSSSPRKSQEPIIISSSPAAPSSTPSSPCPRQQYGINQHEKMPQSIQSVIAASTVSTAKNVKAKQRRIPAVSQPSGSPSKYKQTSLQSYVSQTRHEKAIFTNTVRANCKSRNARSDAADAALDSDNELEPISTISARLSASSPTRSTSNLHQGSQGADPRSNVRSTKKKLHVPNPMSGIYVAHEQINPIEEDDGIFAGRRHTSRSSNRAAATRISDLSVIDLTGDA